MDEEIVIDTLAILGERCNRCDSKPAELLHSCPYAIDIYDDPDVKCDCCSHCAQECAMDI